VISWLLLKLILVPEDPLIVHLGSDKVLTGYIEYSTTLPWARSAQQVLSPEQITLEDGQPREVTLVLEPLGQSHPQGLGSEIWIYEIASELERIGPERFDSLHLPASWKYDEKRRAIVFLGGEHTPLSLRLKAIGKVSLRLLRHPWSGQARITVDGMSRVVDLYSSEFRRVQEVFLLQLPLEVTQRIETVLPRTTQQARLVFTGGPRLVRLERVEWHSRSVWAWDPKRDTFEVGPGVQIVEKSEAGWLIQIEQSDGWIAFHDLQTKPFFLPGSWGVIVILLLGFVWWTVGETYRPRTRVGAFLRSQTYWAQYALPCLAVWFIYWLAFFPGLMSIDSIAQWRQILGIWPIVDDHPAVSYAHDVATYPALVLPGCDRSSPNGSHERLNWVGAGWICSPWCAARHTLECLWVICSVPSNGHDDYHSVEGYPLWDECSLADALDSKDHREPWGVAQKLSMECSAIRSSFNLCGALPP
jgi:hypothetical protein